MLGETLAETTLGLCQASSPTGEMKTPQKRVDVKYRSSVGFEDVPTTFFYDDDIRAIGEAR